MSDLYNELIDELEKNDIFVHYSTIEPKIILDLSGHDKPFKVKIRELKESYQKNTREIWALEKEMDIILNTLDLKLQNNKVAVLKENNKVVELDFSEHDKVFEDKIKKLREECDKLYKQLMETEKDMQKANESLKQKLSNKDKKIAELTWKNDELQQRIAELESKETETCEKEPISNDCRPSIEWYDNRHQSDCIEINRLNTTIDVLIHKVEYLRQFAGLE